MDDVRAVMNAADSKEATLFGYSEGGAMCALFAATYPERTSALVLMGGYARRQSAPDYGRCLAQHIRGARFVGFDADDHVPFGDSMGQVLDETQQFVTGRTELHSDDRVVSTIMFTDIVNSTRIAADMRDSTWSDSLDAHHAMVRKEVAVHRGTEVKITGDGFHATFDGPARAIRCGQAICHSIETLGLEVRVGIHTGESVRRGDELEGIAVHIAARIGAFAEAGQVLVSRTVRDLVAGSGTLFKDQGAHQLKGVDGEWSVCEATRNPAIREKNDR